MIIVLGRPRVYRPQPDGPLAPGGLAAEIAMAIGRAGVGVEIVGSIGDDPEGDQVVVDLDAVGVGHAALLRDPAARTPTFVRNDDAPTLPRLDAADVELGLSYVPECSVLVIAAVLEPDALAKTLESADYHGAAVVVVAPAGTIDAESLSDGVTLLERPAPEDEEATADEPTIASDDAAFGGFVAEYALRLNQGESPAQAFEAALGDSAWEPSTDE